MKKTWVIWMGILKKRRRAELIGILLLGAGILLLSTTLVAGFMPKRVVAKSGGTVIFNYTLTLEDGTVIHTTNGNEPAQYVLGEGKLIPGFEEAIIGMRAGESKTVIIPPEQAYGQHRPELVGVVSRSMLPEDVQPTVGGQLQATAEDGTPYTVTITEFTDTTVTLDANSPLAGKNLVLNVELMALGESPIPGDNLNQTYLSRLLLVLGILASGFAFFYIRRRHSIPGIRLLASSRRAHSTGYRRR